MKNVIPQIRQAGDPILRQQAAQVTAAEVRTQHIQNLIEMMREAMRDAPGVGLAAPQIGVPLQIIVVEDREEYHATVSQGVLAKQERRPIPFHVLVNPRIVDRQDSQPMFFEGCLSIPDYRGLVRRHRSVCVEALNEFGQSVRPIHAEGWYARILQHEVDHLHGMLYVDRMEPRSFSAGKTYSNFFKEKDVKDVCKMLGVENDSPPDAAE